MYEDRFVLHLETTPGTYPDTTIAARAILDWADLVTKTIAAIDPLDRVVLEIAGVTPGSTRFPQILRFLETQANDVKEAWREYPHLKSIVAGSAHTLYTSLVAAGVTLAMQPTEQVVRLSDEDRALLQGMQAKATENTSVQDASKRLYRTLETGRNIEGVGVASNWRDRPEIIVPRADFAERGGLWEMQADLPDTRPQRDIWDVVVVKPALVSKPQAWQFSRDGLKFFAQMADPAFLLAMKERRVPLTMQEGVTMKVEVEYQEVLVGQIWEVVPRTRKIVRVLSPAPLPQPAP